MEATVHRPVSELDGRVAPRIAAGLTALATSGYHTPNEAPERAHESPNVAFHSFAFALVAAKPSPSPLLCQARRRRISSSSSCHCSLQLIHSATVVPFSVSTSPLSRRVKVEVAFLLPTAKLHCRREFHRAPTRSPPRLALLHLAHCFPAISSTTSTL